MIPTLRAKRITAALRLDGKGLEYGPLHRTLIPRAGHDVRYVDYADRETLVSHYYKRPNVDVDLIPEIDIVTDGESIQNFVEDNSIDYIIASHVLEHVPDLLGWIEQNLSVLKPGGRIAIAFPDKRFSFDIGRTSSTVSSIIAAYLEKRTQPTFDQICDHFWNVSSVSPHDAWNGKTTALNAKYIHGRVGVLKLLNEKLHVKTYQDCHCWVFSDEEFINTIITLYSYIDIKCDIVSFFPTRENQLEFFVTIERKF